MSPTGSMVLRRLAISISVMTVVSSLAAIRFSGFWPTCTSNQLFYRGAARFSDLLSVFGSLNAANPYSTGFEYPPGSLPVIRLLAGLTGEVPPQSGIAWLYDYVGSAIPQEPISSCQPEALLWAHLVLILFGALTVALLMYWFFATELSSRERAALAVVTGVLFGFCMALIELYTIVLLVVGTTSLASLWLLRNRVTRLPVYVFVLLLATSYPVVYGVDRGNLDVVVLLLVAAFAASQALSHRKWAMCGGTALLGVAVAIKLWPVFLVGALFRRGSTVLSLTVFLASIAVTSLLGTLLFSLDVPTTASQLITALTRNSGAVTSDWNLLFNYTWGAGLSYLVIMIGGSELLETLRPLWLGTQGWLVIIAQFAAFAVLLLKRPFWQTFGLASCLSLLFITFAPPYRVAILLVAAGLLVHHLSTRQSRPSRLEMLAVTLLGLVIAPTYLWSLPGITPLGVAPSGTLVGSLLLTALTVIYVTLIVRTPTEARENAGSRRAHIT